MVYFQSIASFSAQTQNRSPVYLYPEGKATGSTFKLSLNDINLSWLVDCWEGKGKKREAVASRLRAAREGWLIFLIKKMGILEMSKSEVVSVVGLLQGSSTLTAGNGSVVHQLYLHYMRCSPKQYCFTLKFIHIL